MVRKPAHHPFRAGFVTNSVLFSMALVVVTALVVGTLIAWVLRRQVEQATDQRLADGLLVVQTSLEERHDLLSRVGVWLAEDRELRLAIQEGRLADVRERVSPAIRLLDLDDVTLAAPGGEVLARFGGAVSPSSSENIGQRSGFLRASGGASSYGFTPGSGGALRQEVFVPVRMLERERLIGVLCLAASLDDAALQQFRRRTGLEASLLYGDERIATTLHDRDGAPLRAIGADPYVLGALAGESRLTASWRDFPMGTFRVHYLPLAGPDGSAIGMLSVALPASAALVELGEQLLPVLPLTLLMLICAAWPAYLLARRVRDPVLALASAAARLQAGDLSTPIPRVKEPELAVLAGELESARTSFQAKLRAVANEEARQRALLAALHEPVLTTGTDGRIVEFNPAAAALFGGAVRLYGRSIYELIPFIPRADAQGGEQEPAIWEGQLADVTGRSLDVEVSRARLVEGQRPPSDVYVLHDISRHAELNRLREQLLYSVAHELRGPVTVLENALEIVTTEYATLPAADFQQLLASARRTTVRLRVLMEGLLSAGSIQSGRFVVRPQPARVSALLAEALEAVEVNLAPRRQRIERQLSDERLCVLADRRYTVQVLANLLNNASKYSPEGEVIQVRAARENGDVLIAVEDHGPGIPAEQRAGLFERFYRVRARNEEPGTGLGLAIVKGIVEAHGGTVGVDSKEGRGTRVWFTLPAAPEPVRREDPIVDENRGSVDGLA
jgi:two-component system, OmpR family, phosphate regulon sensor histidine kinase PhoR